MDPNTDFEFNLQLLASEEGYTTTANGKVFLVRKALQGDPHFSAITFLHLRFLSKPTGKHLRKHDKVRGGECWLRAGKWGSLEPGGGGEEPPVLHQRPAHADLQGPAGQAHRYQHGHAAPELSEFSSNVFFSSPQQHGTLSPLTLCAIQSLMPAH